MTWLSTAKFAAASFAAALIALAVAELSPRAWSSVGAWLRPPYVYVVINGIIISIVASSKFHFNGNEKLSAAARSTVVVVVPPEESYYYHHRQGQGQSQSQEIVVVKEVIELADEKRSTVKILPEDDVSLELPVEKPNRKLAKQITPTQDGLMALKASKPKRHESFENTWKMITEGRQTPLARQMKKCDTWNSNHRQIIDRDLAGPHAVDKSETFKHKANHNMPAVTPKLRKEPSLSPDELNKRVEAFIEKFNEEMRLQRQESLNQYMEMINRGAS